MICGRHRGYVVLAMHRAGGQLLGVLGLTAAALIAAQPSAASVACGVRFPARVASPWPSMRHDVGNSGQGTIAASYHGDRPWSFTTGAGLFITPVIGGNGVVYFGSADHDFYAVGPGGRLCWKLRTGNIIDAAAALDSAGRTVTIGSGDDYLYHLNTDPRAHRVIWRYRATHRPATGQLVDWWEGDVAFGLDENIYTGNTGGVIYSFTPGGRLRWTFAAGNSVWTMPAFGRGGTTYWGSVDRNVYALDASGRMLWSAPTLGFVVSSPALGSDGTVYLGSFDSKLYALNPVTGATRWTFGTQDHIYGSAALAHDAQGDTTEIYVASTDGSVYALSPAGKLLWSYDTGEPIRSSPVLGPAPAGEHRNILYVGSSDGLLYALDADTGRRRWSFNTVAGDPILRDRHELNSSPALGRSGVYIGSEDGHLWYVPYDYCLHRADPRCSTAPGTPYPANFSRVLPVSSGGTVGRSGSEGPVPDASEITGRLIVRQGGSTVYASMLPRTDAGSLVRVHPSFGFQSALSGDGRFLFITPQSFLAPATTYHVLVAGKWGAGAAREANYNTPGTWTRYGRFGDTFSFRTAPAAPAVLPLRRPADRVTTLELRRLALPLPAFLTSVNQIGFDSYVLLMGVVSIGRPGADGRGPVLLWSAQARQTADGAYQVDPHGVLVFPLAGYYRGNSFMLSVQGATLTFSFGQVPLQQLDMDFALTPSLHSEPGAGLFARARCAAIPNYGPVAYLTGLCNPGGILAAAGTYIIDPYRSPAGRSATSSAATITPPDERPPGVAVASMSLRRPSAAAPGSVTATLRLSGGVRYPGADHRLGVLLVDSAGQPLGVDYTAQTTTTDSRGDIVGVTLSIPAGTAMPEHLRAYVMSDVFPLAQRQLY